MNEYEGRVIFLTKAEFNALFENTKPNIFYCPVCEHKVIIPLTIGDMYEVAEKIYETECASCREKIYITWEGDDEDLGTNQHRNR
jgi:hypothetical protein